MRRSLALAALLVSLPAVSTGKDVVCPKPVMTSIENLNRRWLRQGAHAVIDATGCDGNGKLSMVIIRRIRDGKITRWQAENGTLDLLQKLFTD